MTKDFSRILALLRRERKISQKTVAQALGVSQALLSHYENGAREPGLAFVAKVADYYGVSCDYLLGRSMTPEGSSVAVEQIPNSSEEKDNVLKGNVTAFLHKKLLVNSVVILMEIVGRFGSKQLVLEVSTYLSVAIYKVYRSLFAANKQNDEAMFRTDISDIYPLCDCEMKMSELRISKACKGEAGYGLDKEHVSEVDMNTKKISEEFPGVSHSLFTLLQTVTELISKKNK